MTAYSASATGSTSATIPTHSTGDLIVIYAFRDTSSVIPDLPAGYTSVNTLAANNAGSRIGYKVATSSSETSGTWTNATDVIASVYTSDGTLSVGASSILGGFGSTASYSTFTLDVTDGSSWVIGADGCRSTNQDASVAPTGMTNRALHVNGVSSEAGLHDTNGGVSSWSTQTTDLGSSSGWHTACIEITEVLSSLTVTDVDTDEIITNGQSAVITGTGFESPNVVTIDGVTQTVTGTPTSTSITITHVLGTMKYGSQTVTVTNDSSDSGTKDITVNPASGDAYVTLTSVTSSDITAIASLVIGDQLEYENTTTGGDAVSVSAGGVISIDGDPAGDSFDVRANDGTGWGTSAAQSATGETPVQTQDGTGALIVTYPSLTS